MSTACLYTTVINRCGFTRSFSIFPPHGRRLEHNEQVSIPGDLMTRIAGDARAFKSLENQLTSGDLVILKTPSVVLYDSTDDEVKVLALSNGSLGVADPCYGGFSSSADG